MARSCEEIFDNAYLEICGEFLCRKSILVQTQAGVACEEDGDCLCDREKLRVYVNKCIKSRSGYRTWPYNSK